MQHLILERRNSNVYSPFVKYIAHNLSVLRFIAFTIYYFIVIDVYLIKYSIDLIEMLRITIVIFISFIMPGFMLSSLFHKYNDRPFFEKILFYLTLGLPTSLLIFYLCTYYNHEFLYLIYLIATFIFLVYHLIKGVKSYNNKTIRHSETNSLLLLAVGIIIVLMINRPLKETRPIMMNGVKVYDTFIIHDCIEDLSIAQLLIKDNKMEYAFMLGGLKSKWGYNVHSPIGYLLTPYISKYANINPVTIFYIVVPILLQFLLAFCAYLILREILKNRYISYIGFILILSVVPVNLSLKHLLGTDISGFNLTVFSYFFRSSMGIIYLLLLFYLLLRYNEKRDTKILFLVGLILDSLFCTREIVFLILFIAIICAFGIHFSFEKEKKRIFYGAMSIVLTFLPLFLYYLDNHREVYYDINNKIFNPQKIYFKFGILSQYYLDMIRCKDPHISHYLSLIISWLSIISPNITRYFIGIVSPIIYGVITYYGFIYIFLLIWLSSIRSLNIAYTSLLILYLIVTVFMNSLYAMPIPQTELGIMAAPTCTLGMPIYFMSILAAIIITIRISLRYSNLLRNIDMKKFLIILSALSITLLPISYLRNVTGEARDYRLSQFNIDRDLLNIYEYLRREQKKPVVIMEHNFSYRYSNKGYCFNPMTQFSGQYAILNGERNLGLRFGVFEQEILDRRRDIELYFITDSASEQERILQRYKIAYVIDDGSLKIKTSLQSVMSSGRYILYKVMEQS